MYVHDINVSVRGSDQGQLFLQRRTAHSSPYRRPELVPHNKRQGVHLFTPPPPPSPPPRPLPSLFTRQPPQSHPHPPPRVQCWTLAFSVWLNGRKLAMQNRRRRERTHGSISFFANNGEAPRVWQPPPPPIQTNYGFP